jgi:polyphosphate kinase
LELLEQASTDKNVISIKITIYRLASNSRIVQALAKAAENGKEVLVLMELRARFDEQNNIRAAEKLLDAGCTVIYGFEEYKVHSKICLITFTHRNEIRTITQIGTGNYNEKTSRLYTDFSYITANPAIGQDAQLFFRNMQISSVQGAYQKLLSSPDALKAFVLDQIQNQITLAKQGKPAQIRLKMNSVTDLDIIKALSQASQAGVSVTMVVRGICCLLPGMKNWTENIQIYSIVGRYLEHSRIYIFGPDEDCSVYISSADFMTRNTERRVEIAVPIEEPQLKQELINYFALLCKDNTKRRILMPSGAYKKPDAAEDEPLCAQDTCMRLAQEHVWVPEKKHFAALRQWLSSIRQ